LGAGGKNVEVTRETIPARGIRFCIRRNGAEVARAYLYVLSNDLHEAPFGLMEDVFVDESRRGAGLGTRLVGEVIAAAKESGCYKLIATSRDARPRVHELYRKLGFSDHGREFRMDVT
jgi:GNAT superfamily N-acetyltransferase